MLRRLLSRIRNSEDGAGILEAVVLISVFLGICFFLMIMFQASLGLDVTRSDRAASGTGFWRGDDVSYIKEF